MEKRDKIDKLTLRKKVKDRIMFQKKGKIQQTIYLSLYIYMYTLISEKSTSSGNYIQKIMTVRGI